MSTKRLPFVGETFAFPLANGMYGCCRVLRFLEKNPNDKHSCDAVLVACCNWVGSIVPNINEIDLKPIMQLTHHKWDKPCVNWVTSPVDSTFIKIGNIPPTESELKSKCNTTVKWSYMPIQRLHQWEWDNEQKAHT